MGRKKTVATRSVGNKTLDKEVCFKHVLRQGEIQLMVLTRGGLSLAERGKLGIALCHGAEGMRKQTKELNESKGRRSSGGFPCAGGAAGSEPADGGAWGRKGAISGPGASGAGAGPVFSRRGGRRAERERGGGGGGVR